MTAIVLGLFFQKVSAALKTMAIAVLLPAGVWLLFAIKYATVIGLTLMHLLNFFLWQLLLPVTVVSVSAGLTATPFWAIQRGSKTKEEPKRTLKFACSGCGAMYRSKPLICVECGKEGLVREGLE
jgi:hypothetical protein